MSQTKDEIIKRNLEFVYGKNKQEMQYDLDKVRHVRDRPTAADIDDSIVCFEGEYQCFLPAHPCEVILDLIDTDPYPSFEHALLASKLSDQTERNHIRSFGSIIEAKRHISKLKGGRPEVFLDNWSDRCLSIAERLLMDKFIKNKQFAGALVGSKDKRIVYQNKFNDLFWGVDSSNLKNGSNHLGKLLVKIRSYFVSSQHISVWISSYISFIDGDKVRVVVNISHTPGAIGASSSSSSSSSVSSDKKEDGMLLMGGEGESKVLDKIPKLLFGKSDECHVEALHPTISRQHMLLAVDRSLGPFIVDLNSSNGTFVAGTKLLPFKFCSYPAVGSNTITMGASTRKYSLQIDMRADIARQKELLAKIDEESSKELSGKDGENTVFVGNISFDASEQQLSMFFSTTCGAILRLSMPKDRGSFTHKGIAFITFSHYSSVAKALMKDGEELQGRPLKVKRSSDNSRPKQTTTSSSSSSNRSDNTRKYSDDPKYGRTLDSSVVDRRAVISSGQQRDDSSSYREHRNDDREQEHRRRDHHFDPPMVDRQRRGSSDRRDGRYDRDDSCDSRSKSKRGRSRDREEEEDCPRWRRRK